MTIRVLSFDVSTCTGYGFWDAWRDVSSIETGLMELPAARHFYDKGEKKHDYNWDDWRVAQAGPKVVKLLKWYKPDFVLVEERMRFAKKGDAAFAMTNAIHGALYSHCCSMNILFGTIYSQSWRKSAYGEDFKQPLVPELGRDRLQKVDPATGKLLFKKKDWGDIAVEKCESLGIQLPSKKDTQHNAAEAALIATRWRLQKKITVPAERDHQRYIELLQRPRQAVAA